MGYVRAKEINGKIVPASVSTVNGTSTRKYFDKSKESTLGAVARNIYKPVRETISTLGGAPGDIWNALAGLTNIAQEKIGPYLKVGEQESGGLPMAPESITSHGIREDIAKPIGESLFGAGSQEPQSGFVEGLTERAAKWAPYTIGGAASSLARGGSALGGLARLGGGLATSLAQGAVGQGLEASGVGTGGQFAGEALTGLGLPVAGKLFGRTTKKATRRIAEKLTAQESSMWNKVDEAAAKAGKVEASSFEGALIKAEKDLRTNVVKTNRKATESIIEEAYNSIGKNKIDTSLLVGTRKKINNAISSAREGGSKVVLKNIKNALDETLGKSIGNLNLDAASATIAKKDFLKSSAYKELIGKLNKSDRSAATEIFKKIVPYGAALGSFIFKSPAVLASVLGVSAGSRIIKNATHILGNKRLRSVAFKALGKIGTRSAITTTAESVKRSEEIKKSTKTVGYVRYAGK